MKASAFFASASSCGAFAFLPLGFFAGLFSRHQASPGPSPRRAPPSHRSFAAGQSRRAKGTWPIAPMFSQTRVFSLRDAIPCPATRAHSLIARRLFRSLTKKSATIAGRAAEAAGNFIISGWSPSLHHYLKAAPVPHAAPMRKNFDGIRTEPARLRGTKLRRESKNDETGDSRWDCWHRHNAGQHVPDFGGGGADAEPHSCADANLLFSADAAGVGSSCRTRPCRAITPTGRSRTFRITSGRA